MTPNWALSRSGVLLINRNIPAATGVEHLKPIGEDDTFQSHSGTNASTKAAPLKICNQAINEESMLDSGI